MYQFVRHAAIDSLTFWHAILYLLNEYNAMALHSRVLIKYLKLNATMNIQIN